MCNISDWIKKCGVRQREHQFFNQIQEIFSSEQFLLLNSLISTFRLIQICFVEMEV